jgi:hypothetical protein
LLKLTKKNEPKICSNLPNFVWYRKKHIVQLPYLKEFNEKNTSTKARPIQINQELLLNELSPTV